MKRKQSVTLDQLAQHLIKALEKLSPEEREKSGKQVDQELAKTLVSQR